MKIIPKVSDKATARLFVKWAVKELGGGFHPDTPARDYVSLARLSESVFNPEECAAFDRSRKQAFRFLGDDFYDLAFAEAQTEGHARAWRGLRVMGCDIHAFVEVKGIWSYEEDKWSVFCALHSLQRDYSLFGRMAGVRHDELTIYEARGWPKDCDVKPGSETELDLIGDVQHHRSWLTLEELRHVLRKHRDDSGSEPILRYWEAVVASMAIASEFGDIRQRLYFVAYTHGEGRRLLGGVRLRENGDAPHWHDADGRGEVGGLADAAEPGRTLGRPGEAVPDARLEPRRRGADGRLVDALEPRLERHARDVHDGGEPGRLGAEPRGPAAEAGAAGGVGDAVSAGRAQRRAKPGRGQAAGAGASGKLEHAERPRGRRPGADAGPEAASSGGRFEQRGQRHDPARSGAVGGFWADAVWIPCTDGKQRPVEPGSFPLVNGATARVGRLRAYGNAIVPWLAAEFVRAAVEAARG